MSDSDPNALNNGPARRHWLARSLSWKLWLPVALFVFAVAGVLTYRESRLSAIPDIGEPFDVEEFCKLSVEPADNAWLDYEVAFTLLVPGSHGPPWEEFYATVEGNWANATPGVRKWLSDNQPALERWRAGTAKDHSLRVRPGEATYRDYSGGVSAQRTLMQLAQLDALRREADGDLTGAWDSLRSLLRYSRHIGMNDTGLQRMIGIAAHQDVVEATCRWANLDQVTAEQLQTALKDVHADYQMTTPLSAAVKLDYLIAIDKSNRGEVLRESLAFGFKAFGDSNGGPPSRPALFLMHEPALSRRLLQYQVANLLQYIDQPACTRPHILGSYAFFDSLPAPGSRFLSPADFEFESSRAAFADVLLLNQVPIGFAVREAARESVLEVTLAAQLYRHEFGQLPETLSELVSHEMLTEIPGDPWGNPGSRIQYQRDPADPSRAKVWSVGTNRVDDGGRIEFREPGVGDEGLWIGEPPDPE